MKHNLKESAYKFIECSIYIYILFKVDLFQFEVNRNCTFTFQGTTELIYGVVKQ